MRKSLFRAYFALILTGIMPTIKPSDISSYDRSNVRTWALALSVSALICAKSFYWGVCACDWYKKRRNNQKGLQDGYTITEQNTFNRVSNINITNHLGDITIKSHNQDDILILESRPDGQKEPILNRIVEQTRDTLSITLNANPEQYHVNALNQPLITRNQDSISCVYGSFTVYCPKPKANYTIYLPADQCINQRLETSFGTINSCNTNGTLHTKTETGSRRYTGNYSYDKLPQRYHRYPDS